MRRLIGLALCAIVMGAALAAQEKPLTPAGITVTGPEKPAAEQPIPDDAKRALVDLQQQAAGLERARAVLQKELDSVTAEWSRLIAKLQAAAPAGYELTPQLTYAKKPPPKQDESKPPK